MAFLDNEDLRLLAESVDRFVQTSAGGTAADDSQMWSDIAALGWIGIDIDPDHGGVGGGAAAVAAVMRGIGGGLFRLPYVSTAVLAAGLIERAGSPAQRHALLPRLIEGDLVIALADREADSGHDRHRVRTTATPTAEGYRLNGRKQFVVDAPIAGQWIVTAWIEGPEDRIGLFLVDPRSAGIESLVYRTIDHRAVADLRFDDVRIDAEARLPGAAVPALDMAYARATLALCAEACGIATAVNAITLDYLKTRRQFGATLGSFQVLQHRMVDMAIDEQQMNAITERATAFLDAGAGDADRWISATKVIAGKAGRRIAEASIQLHGGMGMTEELIVGRYLKRMLMIATQFGDEVWHLDQLDATARRIAGQTSSEPADGETFERPMRVAAGASGARAHG